MTRSPNIFAKLTYGLFVAFIYLNIVMPGSYNFIIVAKKYVFIALITTFFVYALTSRAKLSFQVVGYVILSMVLIACMSVFSLVSGNEPADVAQFASPLLFLAAGPVIFGIRSAYKIDGYLKHVLISVVTISIATLVLAGISLFYMTEAALFLQAIDSNFNINWFPASGVRISVQTSPFMPAGIYIAYSYYSRTKNNMYLVACVLIAIAIYFTKTVGIWLALFAGFLILVVVLKKIRLSSLIATLVLLGAVSVVALPEINNSWGDKEASYDVKRQQVTNGWRVFQDHLWFGRGLGFRFTDIDDRNENQSVIEVLPILLLVDGGIFGFGIYVFIYFAPLLLAFVGQRKPDFVYVVAIAHLSVIAAGFTNPYFISGGTGLFFVVLLLAFARDDSTLGHARKSAGSAMPANRLADA